MRKAIHARTDARPQSASLGVASSAEHRKNFINNTEHQLQPSKEFDLEPKKQKAGRRKLGTGRIASRGPVVHPVARRQKTVLISASFKQKNTCIAPALNIRLQVARGRDQQGDSTLQLYIQDHVTQADGSSSSGLPNMLSQSTPCTSRIRPSSCSLNGRAVSSKGTPTITKHNFHTIQAVQQTAITVSRAKISTATASCATGKGTYASAC